MAWALFAPGLRNEICVELEERGWPALRETSWMGGGVNGGDQMGLETMSITAGYCKWVMCSVYMSR